MRGSEKDRKVHYEWYQFEIDCERLALKITPHEFSNVMGVRRGGIALAVKLSSMLFIPLTNNPNLHTLVVDDIVDSGETRDHYAMCRFASLYYKPWAKKKPDYYVHTTEDWICFPWEIEHE